MKNIFVHVVIVLCINFSFVKAQTLLPEQKQEAYQAAVDFQLEMNLKFADSSQSPLKQEDLKRFTTLNFFNIDTQHFVVKARFEKLENEKPFAMKTTTQRLPEYKRFARLHFNIGGNECQLYVYQNLDLAKLPQYKNYLFIPFTDLSNGFETYGGGRYLDLEIPDSEEIILNFNKAYNPYCAYNEKYSCPIPPKENHLNIAIKAGVLAF
jgi:uncharacterized protein (DUF1684 family)